MKSRPVNAWWGTMVGLDFEGIAVHAESPGQLRFATEAGDRASIGSLLARSGRPELAATPVLSQLCERKWEAWARGRYWRLLATFALAMAPYTVEATVGPGLAAGWQSALVALAVAAWAAYGRTKAQQLWARGLPAFVGLGWNVVDLLVLALLPLGAVGHVFDALDLQVSTLGLAPELQPPAIVLDAFLQLLFCLRFLRYLSVFSGFRIGSYLNSVLGVLSSSWQPLLFLALVIASFALGFLILFSYDGKASGVPPQFADFFGVATQLVKWLFEPSAAFTAFGDLRLEAPGFVLFVLYYCAAVLGSLRILTECAAETVETSAQAADMHWRDVRSRVVDDIEEQMMAGSAEDRQVLQEFYATLRDGGELLQVETRVELWPRRPPT